MVSVALRNDFNSSTGLKIDLPVPNNTLTNQPPVPSLYQECSRLKSRLIRIRGFDYYFELASRHFGQPMDPVTQLWDVFSLGISLCFIFDLLAEDKGLTKLDNSKFISKYEPNPDRAKMLGIIMFAMKLTSETIAHFIPDCEPFAVTDLLDRSSSDGFVKAVKIVKAIVEQVTRFRANIIDQMVETEREYVRDLEIMQKYSVALSQNGIIDLLTNDNVFPGLDKLLNFQRKFLIRIESTADLHWHDQCWGELFTESEEEFVVYESYCRNYTTALKLIFTHEENLAPLNHLINAKGELPTFVIKPIQHIGEYSLLLDALIKASSAEDYFHYEELKAGSDATKRIMDKINEFQCQAMNEQTLKDLKAGHKVYKGNSIVKKQGAGSSQPQQKTIPLHLKGCVFVSKITQAVFTCIQNSNTAGVPPGYPLRVWWEDNHKLDDCIICCRQEYQMEQWVSTITQLIGEGRVLELSENTTNPQLKYSPGDIGVYPSALPSNGVPHSRDSISGSECNPQSHLGFNDYEKVTFPQPPLLSSQLDIKPSISGRSSPAESSSDLVQYHSKDDPFGTITPSKDEDAHGPDFNPITAAYLQHAFSHNKMSQANWTSDILGTQHDETSVQQLMDILQLELDNVSYSDLYLHNSNELNLEAAYRKRCLQGLRQLSIKYQILPSVLMINHVKRHGQNPVAGGGFADIWHGDIARLKAADTKEDSQALLWRQLKHPNILPLLGVNTDLFSPSFCLISPWMENGNIISYLKQNPMHNRYKVFLEIAAGLSYLHSRNPPIIHGDIRGANILVTDDLQCCLADFGLALVTADSRSSWATATTSTMKGAIRWMAPEDIYAFGCTIVEILTLRLPFHDEKTDAAVLYSLIAGERPTRPQNIWCSDTLWDLTTRCWMEIAAARPHASEVYEILRDHVMDSLL
ncbi:hypothetical protein BT96DRAFT_990639 [Gymnopus androsaceus JB14]|uniref:Uncharacterized protein n=1 Tax=Gymnopus androsaceus JB14 TaxID=1447944 RepID=A0A6A4HXP2_9AGAR|nr:hypothetical protein BT96DRAFT_990639 [Gymnopus androsaceus JB14]